MAFTSTPLSLGNRKLVVLGVPWDVDTEGLRKYMINYGPLDDVIVMKDRVTGRSRGFGYVTFQSPEDAEKVLSSQHLLNGRTLEVKVATPREDMTKPPGKKNTRIFVARIPPTVTDDMFRSYFEKYGMINDAYMPKDQGSKAHRGIGFITFENPESVDRVMMESHELAGSTIAVDRATPKEESGKYWDKLLPAYGVFSHYINAARFGAFGMPPVGSFDYGGSFPSDVGAAASGGGDYGSGVLYGGPPVVGGVGVGYGAGNTWQTTPVPPANMAGTGGGPAAASGANYLNATSAAAKPIGKKVFVGRIPAEATADDVRLYFSNFGRLLDVYLPKDKNKTSHRGFGFVTFAEESAAERVAQRPHELLGQQLAVDRATPLDEATPNTTAYFHSGSSTTPAVTEVASGGPMRGNSSSIPGTAYGNNSGSFDFNNAWGSYGGGSAGPIPAGDPTGSRMSRMDLRYKPY